MPTVRSTMKTRSVIKFALLVLAASSLAVPALSQAVDSAGSRTEVTWAMSITTEGSPTSPRPRSASQPPASTCRSVAVASASTRSSESGSMERRGRSSSRLTRREKGTPSLVRWTRRPARLTRNETPTTRRGSSPGREDQAVAATRDDAPPVGIPHVRPSFHEPALRHSGPQP
jgi:hypothetical protein